MKSNNVVSKLDKIFENLVLSIENSQSEIIEIGDHSKKEYEKMKETLKNLNQEILQLIADIEKTEKKLSLSKTQLMNINQSFQKYSQAEMKKAYARADELMVELAVLREREAIKRKERNDLENSIRSQQIIVEKSEKLFQNISLTLDFLNGDLKGIVEKLEDIESKQALGTSILKIQEKERQRIAMDIHDGPAQALSNIVLKSDLCIKLLDIDKDKSKYELENIKKMTRNIIDTLREIIYNLRPMSLDDLGLIPTLEKYIGRVEEETNLEIQIKVINSPRVLDPIVTLSLYRITQEAIHNIVKYAEAVNVEIKLTFLPQYIELIITDDGNGFSAQDQNKNRTDYGGLGLTIMEERAKLLNGNFKIKSIINGGTKCFVRIPMRQN